MINEKFLLRNKTAEIIYEKIKNLPIIDYHCHLNPKEIAENKAFKNITELWLGGDHYKWRLMRANGIEERYITGDADDYEKFLKWAETIEEAVGNPIYHWTNLELKRYFGYNKVLGVKNAKEIWEYCNKIIQSGEFNVKSIFKQFNVKSLCTTDDPADDLKYHKQIAADSEFDTKVYPTFRPSNVFNVNSNYSEYIKKLEKSADMKIDSYKALVNALYSRMDYFNQNLCRLSDHSFDPFVYEDYNEREVEDIFSDILNGEFDLTKINKFKTALFYDLNKKYFDLDWSVQIHMNCIRNANAAMFEKLGPDTGYDCIGDTPYADSLVKTFDSLCKINKLPRTIVYSLNPNDFDMLTTIIACYQGGGIKGKMQLGSAWWFNDHIKGMENQMISLANNGLLSRFIGMLTDSRSFLSYPRHEYFRRILANLLGTQFEDGLFADDIELLIKIAENISYYNADNYFNFV